MLLQYGLNMLGKLTSKNKLSILIYHGVLESFDPLRPNEPTVESFSWQMALISQYFTPMGLPEATALLKAGRLPANAVCVTFDDGYKNNLHVALPILKKYAIPATVFVATAFSAGENMWNDRILHLFADFNITHINLNTMDMGEHQLGDWSQRKKLAGLLLNKLKYLPVEQRLEKISELYNDNHGIESQPLMMTPAEVAQLAEAGIEIGAHTVNHPILKVMPVEQQNHEIQQSKLLIEKWIGKTVRCFAYPNGKVGIDLDHQTTNIVEKLGFECAVVTDWGCSNPKTSPWMLRRFTPWDKSPLKFHLRLLKNQIFV
ncbi:MAG: peptidoglycan/xylan/chitin deacetylase (PgdA/CDA1 family) [Paraglaciecola sp.]|jgi:peptidoglycan/xylan/chitin deacetylase (PgdA/CDA1 family)